MIGLCGTPAENTNNEIIAFPQLWYYKPNTLTNGCKCIVCKCNKHFKRIHEILKNIIKVAKMSPKIPIFDAHIRFLTLWQQLNLHCHRKTTE